MRLAIRLSAICFLLLFVAAAVMADPSDAAASDNVVSVPTGDAIFKQIERQMAGIQDLQAQMVFKILTNRFLKFPITIHADYYFKAPDKLKINLKGLPRLLLGDTPKAITAATTLTGFQKDYTSLYDITVLGYKTVQNQSCYYLKFIPKKSDGNVKETFLWVNRGNYTIPQLLTNYKDGSWIRIKRVYKPFQKYLLVKTIQSDMKFVKENLEANVQAVYENYKINQGLSDTIFEDEKK